MKTPTPKQLGYTNSPFESETMIEHIRRLNEEQARIHEQRRQEALNKIRAMRVAQREQQERHREYQ